MHISLEHVLLGSHYFPFSILRKRFLASDFVQPHPPPPPSQPTGLQRSNQRMRVPITRVALLCVGGTVRGYVFSIPPFSCCFFFAFSPYLYR